MAPNCEQTAQVRLTVTFERYPIGGPRIEIGYYEARDGELMASGTAGLDGDSLAKLKAWVSGTLTLWWYPNEATDEQLSIYDYLDHPF